jgi:hypothetical protein
MAPDGIDQDELGKFEVALVQELAKRGFEMNLTGDNITFQSQKAKQSGSADMAALFRTYKEGTGVPQIADRIIGASGTEKPPAGGARSVPPSAQAAGNPQPSAPRESSSPPLQPKADIDRIYPLIRGQDFLAAYRAYMEKQAGGPLAPDHPSMPKVFLLSKDHQTCIFCGLDINGKFAYVDNVMFAGFGIGEMDFFRVMMQNLIRRMDPIMSGRRFKSEKQPEGTYILRFPDGLAPSFLLIANRYFDLLSEVISAKDAKFFWAFSISGDEMMVGPPTLSEEGLKLALARAYQNQMELSKNPAANLIVRVEPMIILREGMTFPAPIQPSPKR